MAGIENMWYVLLVLLGVVASTLGVENAFTSLNSMENLVNTEERVIDFLNNVISQEHERLAMLKRYLSHYEESHKEAVLDPAAYVRNPLNSYHLMKRLTTDWQDLETIIMKPVPNMPDVKIALDLPVMEDMGGTAEALCRLQDTYKLNTSELLRGVIRGVKYSQPMSANDAWLLGLQMYNFKDFYHANIWFQAALELDEEEQGTNPLKPTDRPTILDYAAFAIYKLGNTRKALELTDQYLELMPNCTRNLQNRRGYIDQLKNQKGEPADDVEKHRPKSSYWNEVIQGNYERLCRGEVEVNHALVCRYTDNGNPYFILRRVKMEEMNLHPKIVVFHDVIYDSEIEQIKKLAKPVITRSLVTDFSDGLMRQWVDKTRVSQTAFLEGSVHEVIANVDRRAGMLANLSEESAEQLQVLNYGIGGHYDAHFDYSESKGPDRGFPDFLGNRIATLLYYMSDVEQGGATVFPEVGAAVFPQKGSAVLWYNLHRDGEGDYRTRHGACPVLIGDKWACNKWFHEGMQEFLRPCLLEQDSLPFQQPGAPAEGSCSADNLPDNSSPSENECDNTVLPGYGNEESSDLAPQCSRESAHYDDKVLPAYYGNEESTILAPQCSRESAHYDDKVLPSEPWSQEQSYGYEQEDNDYASSYEDDRNDHMCSARYD